ncbi:nitric oxide-associated protein 1 [Nematolebias whitei]|uniref:nitric oxide-associated protein 1 n=1 Tax=Nematolebias whitei TaxID=451745 RepID=UPI0018999F29|nr:nitric oxide-associated protein 1 [Nematolebias whitei]
MLKVFQVCVRRQLWRSLSSAAGDVRRPRRGSNRTQVQSCTVDTNLEEEFVFLDCAVPEEDPRYEEQLIHQLRISLATSEPAPVAQVSLQKYQRSLERQLQVLKGDALQEAELNSLIDFQDADFPLDENLVKSNKKKKKKEQKGEHKIFGTPDVDVPISDTCCSGCGAILHCTASDVPGYLPSEKYKVLLQEEKLGGASCQRCHLLNYHHKALNLKLSHDQYRDVVQQIRTKKALVLLLVDLLDLPDSIVPDLPGLVGTNKHVVVLGNKIDLLPKDAPNYLQRIKRQLSQYCQDASFSSQVTDVHLISAKTGYGIEALISRLQRSWKYKGDVYMVGSANSGKSTLFNTLLESDYCKSRAVDVIGKATISPWPGTTLNLLKFPIINPTPYRMFKRLERLKESAHQTEAELEFNELKKLQQLSKHGYLVGRVGRTFRHNRTKLNEIQFDPDSLAFGENEDADSTMPVVSSPREELSFNEVKDAHWLFDTPGIMKERDILHLLQDHEVQLVVPTQAIIPRTFVLKPGMSLFVGALARIDFLQGGQSCWFSVMASNRVPVHITHLDKADKVYEKHAGDILLGVPAGGSERMKQFPALVPQDFTLEGRSYLEAAADITLSSAGWVALTAVEGDQVQVRVHGPAAAGIRLRTPPLLPHIVSLKGKRVPKSATYKPLKTVGMLDGMSADGAQTLQVKKKK